MDLKLTLDVNADNPVEGDLDLVNGNLVFVEGTHAAAQDLLTRLRFRRGEWFLDVREGVPWFEEILKKNPDIPAIRSIFRRAILSSPYVSSIESLALSYDARGRSLSVSFVAILRDGGILDTRDTGPFIIRLA